MGLLGLRMLIAAALGLCHAVYIYVQPHGRDESVPASTAAFVISYNDTRWQRVSSLLTLLGFTPRRVLPIPTNDAVLRSLGPFASDGTEEWKARALSNHLSMRYAMMTAAVGMGTAGESEDSSLPDNGYFLIFEDDIELDEGVNRAAVQAAVHEAAKAAAADGFFYLGLGCDPKCNLNPSPTSSDAWRTAPGTFSWSKHGVEFARCSGILAHAYGVFKWRALWLFDELQAAMTRDSYIKVRHPEYRFTLDLFFWHFFRERQPYRQAVMAGWDLRGHEAEVCGLRSDRDVGSGMFYQAATANPSSIMGLTADRLALQDATVVARHASAEQHAIAAPLRPPPWPQRAAGRPALALTIGAAGNGSGSSMGIVSGLPSEARPATSVNHRYMSAVPASDPLLQRLASQLYSIGTRPREDSNGALLAAWARTFSHRKAWLTIATDSSLRDGDYAVVLEEGEVEEHERLLASPWLPSLAAASAEAGIFWLLPCPPASDGVPVGEGSSDVAAAALPARSIGGVPRCLNASLRAYGIFKWRAAWLWDVLQHALEGDAAFHSAVANEVSVAAHLEQGLRRLLPAGQWPAAPPHGSL